VAHDRLVDHAAVEREDTGGSSRRVDDRTGISNLVLTRPIRSAHCLDL